MVEIKVYNDIANQKDGIFLSMMGMNDTVFSADTVKKIFESNKDEKDFKFNIHCDGGDVYEGLAIYDIIRRSGKNIHANIDGSCHSMAITLLLAAPKENRTANPNARALIHQVYAAPADYLNAEELHTLANEIEKEQNSILDIYAERTGHDRAELENLMKEEKRRTAQELLKYGFISKINTYSTNKNNETMSKKRQEVLNAADSFMKKLKNLLKGSIVNYEFTDENGDILFVTDLDDDTLERDMNAAIPGSDDNTGTFTIPDGRTVEIVKGKIIDVIEPTDEPDDEEIANLKNRLTQLENALGEANTIISNLKNQIRSDYNVRNRLNNPGNKNKGAQATYSEKKNETKEKLNKAKGIK